jgi:tumor protein p53-inducible protein 3
MDILQREGMYPVPTRGSPLLGVEISGTVEQVGSKGKKYTIGSEIKQAIN